jgi:YfiH family protein
VRNTISSTLGVGGIVALRQTHSNVGIVATQGLESDQMYAAEGDFIITQKKNLGLILFTADCIPLVLYNLIDQAIAAVHIGWKGAVTNIVQNVCNNKLLKDNLDKVQVFFGPAALDCCYEVQKDFLDGFDKESVSQCFTIKNGKIFYNNSLFVQLALKSLGILERNIYTDYNICTICSVQYCSYRRDKDKSRRNVTVALFR